MEGLVTNGTKVAIGGYFFYRHPMALVRALISLCLKNLDVISPFGSIDIDMLIGAGCVAKVTYGFISLDVFGLAPNFRRALEAGEVRGVDYGGHTLARSLEAAYRGVTGLPVRTMMGSDLACGHPGRFVELSGERFFFAPALAPEVTLLHVPWATERGELKISGDGFDLDLGKAAGVLIVSAERLIGRREFERCEGVPIARRADVLFEVPYGAHPTSCYPYYVNDLWHLLDYSEASQNPETFGFYLKDFLTGCPSHTEYLQKVGLERLGELSLFARVASSHVRSELE
jgi:glutaconate CoA-transferase subunit A